MLVKEDGMAMTSVMMCDEELVSLQRSDSEYTSGTQQGRKWPQHLAAIIATLAAMSAGCALGWTSPALPLLPFLTEAQASWVGSLLAVGALLGALPAGWLADAWGRKAFLLSLGLPFLLGWGLVITSALALSPEFQVPLLYAARLLLGVAVGAVTVAVPLYNSEIAEDSIRGALGAYLQLMITMGILWVYVVGALAPCMKSLALACAAVPLIFCVAFFWMPESPAYLEAQDRFTEAEAALRWLQGNRGPIPETQRWRHGKRDQVPQTQEEAQQWLQGESEEAQKTQQPAPRASTARALGIVFALMAFQQLSGINAVVFYAGKIFYGPHSAVAAVVVGAVQVAATGAASALADRAGRRALLLASGFGMSTCLIALSVCFYTDADAGSWLPPLAVAAYIALFSVGLGPLPWLIMAELVPADAKGRASALAVCLNWTIVFAVTKAFPGLLVGLGPWATFALFAAVCVVGTVFVATAVPETKGKSLLQIQCELGRP
ncbi:hypothetical protein ANN_27116 [Periplaneta americana]|uniref:Major facilitator superfamily (MFS) profile domain-containing protein n=1 Tax=Periplaneta americana TaxID=6978 RepID=A0ABQ8RXE9_PERAM|nr:hypothetical protein ANN_27116 [Periplaneta americana]